MTKLVENSFFNRNIETHFSALKTFEIQKAEMLTEKNMYYYNVYDQHHCEWINFYRSKSISEATDFRNILEEITSNFYENSLDKHLLKVIEDLKDVYITYLNEIENYIEPAQPSIESYKSLLKYVSFLSDNNSKFYIDAKTGNFGCTIKKRMHKRKRKSLDLVFKSNYEIIFCWTKNMNNLVHIRGIADFDDDLYDASAIRNLIDFY